ncbi:hypothetical protein EHQ16_15120 [Leptospira kanakyensis]|uniref:Glycosyltransferase RgtA/B/C/D-like domain-containing protein n=1 Tax=Leptospira kanakyensis TaxID=2484968 RepID=A0A6N4QKG0_9LEPT|nr:hypothetical protein [Leptospira kanakyensis]TGK53413.1 hypothetical protein EHQ11_03425 [Leptospira kanakyensis]TGK57208.1 hypothetical protein EHQ16_15120 [Leptospira kanakyensis]TGK72919.1 hypothetical protein EHQ18_03500 [Leptospira kanakyensis]
MSDLSTTTKKIEPFLYIPAVIFLIFISIFYLYTGSFFISPKFARFTTLGLLIYFLFSKNGNTLLKFVSLFVFYLSFTNPIPSSDLIPSRFFPLWLDPSTNFKFDLFLDQGSTTLLSENDLTSLQGQMTNLPHPKEKGFLVAPYFLVPGTNEILPTYPWTPGFFNFLIYKTFSFFHPIIPKMNYENTSSILFVLPTIYRLESFSAAILATATSFLLYLILRLKPFSNSKAISFLYVVIYSLCTSHFSNSSQGLWQHTIIEFLLGLILYLVFLENNHHLRFLLIGLFAGILIYSRPSSIFLLTFPVVVLITKFKKFKWSFFLALISFSITLLFFGLLNDSYYQHFLGGYSLHKIAYSYVGHSDLFSKPLWEGLFGLTFSPGFGYYIFSPILLLPLFYFPKIKNKGLFVCLLLPEVFLVLFYAKYVYWEGGHSYGARFLTDINLYSILTFSMIPLAIWKNRIYQIVVSTLLIFSFYVQYFGANQKEMVSLWNSCSYESNFAKSIDFKNLPFHPNLSRTNCTHQ